MSIFDDARNGTLIGARLDNWLKLGTTDLNAQDPSSGWTLLATAVASGFPNQVDQLIKKGAEVNRLCRDLETPLLLATWKTENERPLIVQILLAQSQSKAIIDTTCAIAENKTPLMYAIERADIESVKLLRKAGASLQIKNNDGFNAKEVAQNTGKKAILRALNPEKEQTDLARLAANVITFILHVVAWVDSALNGVIGRAFGITGTLHPRTNQQVNPGPQEPTPQEFVKNVDTFVKDNPALNAFFKDRKDFIQDLAQKSVDLANDPNTDLGSTKILPKTIQVTMHQQVIYCDDSGSMINSKGRAENRWENQKLLALRIARTTTRILPDGEGVAFRFINRELDNSSSLNLEDIGKNINSVVPKGDTNIGTTLRDRILQPLVYSKLEPRTLERPLLITIITDGGPGPDEAKDFLAKVIVECGDKLTAAKLPRESVKFLIGQVGSSGEAVEFLQALKGNTEIAKVAHIFAGRLDAAFAEFRDERGLDRWLIETLFAPLAAGESKKEQ